MKDLLVLLAHLLTTVAKLLGSTGAQAVVLNGLARRVLAISLLGGFVTAEAAVTARVERDAVRITDTLEVLESSQNSQVSIVNGRTTSRIQWVVRLAPTSRGDKVVPPIPIGKLRTAPVRVRVLPARPPPGVGNLPDLFLETAAEPLDPYVQAQSTYTLRLYHLGQLQEGSLADPALQDTIVESLGEDLHYTSQRGKRRYRVIERRYALFPQSSGMLRIPPVTFSGRAVQGARDGANPYGGIFQRTQPVRAQAPAIELHVRPRPAGAGTGPWLPAQMLEIIEEWAPNPPAFRVGQPVTRTFTVRARGLSAAQLPEIPVPKHALLKTYADQPVTLTTAQGVHVVGKRVERHALVPSQSGPLTLPELRIPWWDTLGDLARVAIVPARTIQVEPAASLTQPPVAADKPLRVDSGAPALGQRAQPMTRVAEPGENRIWQATSGLLLLAWLLTLGLLWQQRRAGRAITKKTDAIPGTTRLALREALSAFEQACTENDCRTARQALMSWCEARWPEARPGGIALLVSRLTDPAALAVLREMNTALYGKGSLAWDGTECGAILADALRHLDAAKVGTEKPSPLPALYPTR
jgi:hypothetical protein